MNASLKRDICGIKDRTMLNSEVEGLELRLASVASTELRYACLHWASHLSQASPVDEILFGALESFCGKNLLWWMELLSLLGQFHSAVPSLKLAGESITVSAYKMAEVAMFILKLGITADKRFSK
jgi:hypothetical protein